MAAVDKVFGVEFDIGGPTAEKVLSKTAEAVVNAFTKDEERETLNVVDGLFAIACSIDRLDRAVSLKRRGRG